MTFKALFILSIICGCAIGCNSAYGNQLANEIHKDPAQRAHVLAIVNGKEITTTELTDLNLHILTPEQRKIAVDTLVTRWLLLEQAVKEGFDKQDHIVAAIKSSSETLIVTQFLAKLAKEFQLSDNELKSMYEAKYSTSMMEYKISHILLASKESGQILIDKLVKGDDFYELAAEHSQDMVSASNGGGLGWVTSKDIIPALLQEIDKLKKGEVSGSPVQSPFGWHILKLENKRGDSPPAFKAIKQTLGKEALKNKVKEYLLELRANATIEIM